MKRYKVVLITLAAAFSLGLSSCVKDLDVEPIDPSITLPEDVLNTEEAFLQVLAKCYQGLACSASDGPDSSPDISGVDGGYGQYVRALFQLQEYTTDEAAVCWNDGNVYDLHNLCWTPTNEFVMAMYARIYFQIGLCNELIRKVNENPAGISEDEFPMASREQIKAEARTLRALSYYHAIDMFGNVPHALETDPVGSEGPGQISRAKLFEWLESELKSLVDGDALPEVGENEYGRCDKGLAQMLLAKLCLNAEVYTGTAKWAECAAVCSDLMDEYSLHTTAAGSVYTPYQELFCADNHRFTRNSTYLGDEIIFVVPQDGMNIRSYGVTNFITFAAAGGDMDCTQLGISSGWGGVSCPRQLSELFDDIDQRKIFYTEYGIDMEKLMSEDGSAFKLENSGYKSMKFKNINVDGSAAQHATFVDIDFLMFRLADVYLMYAECKCRLAGGNEYTDSDGRDQFNAVRTRAGLQAVPSFNLQDILDERARELYYECHRRSDLIRFGLFTSDSYKWDWKGGIYEGRGVDDKYKLFPLPADDINSNSKLTQNPGY